MKVYFVRHGQTDWNKELRIQGRTDIPLNDEGIRQAEKSAAFLKEESFDLVVTSPLSRAKQTAEIIATTTGLPLVEMNQFIERDYGETEGLTLEERIARFPDGQYKAVESVEDVITRVKEGLEELQNNYPGKNIIVVSHGGVINALLSHLSNGEIGTGKTKLNNACISKITYTTNTWKIETYNEIDYLD